MYVKFLVTTGLRRFAAVAVAVLTVVTTVVLAPAASAAKAPVTSGIPAGMLVRAEPVADQPQALTDMGAREVRVWFTSRSTPGDRPIVQTGVVLIPAGVPPREGRPVVAYAHGTTGVADACAPSRTVNLRGQLGAVLPLLAKGYVVTAPDYEGLGSRGPHPYLIPQSAARSVIDSVRAARALVPGTSTRWLAYGPSQGGQAAWAANELARTWGRGLTFLGSVSTAPPTDLAPSVADLPEGLTTAQKGLVPMIYAGLRTRYQDFVYSDYLRGPALEATAQLESTCAVRAVYEKFPAADFAPRSDRAAARLAEVLTAQRLPAGRASGPMFVAQGTADDIVKPEWTAQAVARACDHGDYVMYRTYAGAGHPALAEAGRDALDWIADRLAGVRPPTTC